MSVDECVVQPNRDRIPDKTKRVNHRTLPGTIAPNEDCQSIEIDHFVADSPKILDAQFSDHTILLSHASATIQVSASSDGRSFRPVPNRTALRRWFGVGY
jgi:hypothetical protein